MGLKITKITLENFANIYSGLGTKYLEIDLSKIQHTVCVIVGKNGRGKTSLLSYMTPFAGVGNIDVRNGETIIIPGISGYKGLRYIDDINNTTYLIQHYYTPNSTGGHSVKSYIKVNGEEMNLNGNVRSFEQYVYELLGIDTDYIRLVRIGDNVSNIIDAKAAERKTFMAKLLDNVDIYLKQYKRKVQQVTELGAVVTHIADEIAKTGIEDVKESQKEIKQLKYKLNKLLEDIDKEKAEESKIQYIIDSLNLPHDFEKIRDDLKKQLGKYEKRLEKVSSAATSEIISKHINMLEVDEVALRKDYEMAQTKHDMYLGNLNDVQIDLTRARGRLEMENKDLNLSLIRHNIRDLRVAVRDAWESRFDEIEILCSKKDFDNLVVFLKNLQIYVNGIYEFGKEPIKDVIRLIKEGKSVDEYIRGALIRLEDINRKDKMGILDKLIIRYKDPIPECKSIDCPYEDCPYKRLHTELMEIKDTKPNTDKVLHDESYYQSMMYVKDGIAHVFQSLIDSKIPFWSEKVYPEEISKALDKNNIIDNMCKLKPLYDPKVLDKWLEFMTSREAYYELQRKCKEQEELYEARAKLSKENELKDEIAHLEDRVSALTAAADEAKERMKKVRELLDENTDRLEELREDYEAVTKYESVKQEYIDLDSKRDTWYSKKNQLGVLHNQIGIDTHQAENLTKEINFITNGIERYQSLQAELKEKTEILDILELIKYGLSNTKGLPLYYIKYYLQDVLEVANRLLDIIYDGKCYLNDFDISETAFRMPYTKNGITISDVSSASQGEKSFFNMAISSALRAQSMEKYNIALFDEVDSVFDDENRQKTIPVLEELLAISNINQAFLITHNQMFNQYPTDVIDLDDFERSTVPIHTAMRQTDWEE